MDVPALCGQARTVFEAQGHTIDCHVVPGRAVVGRMRQAVNAARFDALIAAGGDGTISAAAAIAYRAGIPLGVLPAGTMNLFARALQMPIELPEALSAIAAGRIGAVDIASANDRSFVHHFSVGLHAQLVRTRDGMNYKSRPGKMLAGLRSVVTAAANPPNFDAEIRTSGRLERRRVSGIAISNNPFGQGHIPHPDRLDEGLLGVYIAQPMSAAAVIRLWSDILLGRWHSSDMVTEKTVSDMVLHFPRHRGGLRAVLDGELIKLEKTITLRVHAGGLKVILPRADGTTES